tara:strand:- start:1158 stop:1622 length:465 start_codon:yes stop_codon:yes gene_type:complete
MMIKNFNDFVNESADGRFKIEVDPKHSKEALDLLETDYRMKYKSSGPNMFVFQNEDDAHDAVRDLTTLGFEPKTNFKIEEGKTDPVFITNSNITDLWSEIYDGEDFIDKHPAIYKILKNRAQMDRREMKRIWAMVYGDEDFEKEHPRVFKRIKP